MKKTIFFLLLITFFFGAIALPAQDFTKFNFERLTELDPVSQVIWMEGFLLGVYQAAVVAHYYYGLSSEDALQLMILDESAEEVLRTTILWYDRTRSWKTPLTVAIFRRKLDY